MLTSAIGTTAGLAGILLTKTPLVYAASRTVTMLTWNHFVEASDAILRQMAREFGKANKCQVKIDFIPHRDTYVKVAKEQETREGHDIVFLFFSKPQMHHEDLETLEFMDSLGQKLGGWYQLVQDVDQVDGRWVAMPWFYTCMPMTYREDLYQQQGFAPPTTWEEWKKTSQKIKEATGKKVGIALNQTEDANISLYAILWSYGPSTVNKERQVTINTAETRKAMDYVKDLYASCMTNEVPLTNIVPENGYGYAPRANVEPHLQPSPRILQTQWLAGCRSSLLACAVFIVAPMTSCSRARTVAPRPRAAWRIPAFCPRLQR